MGVYGVTRHPDRSAAISETCLCSPTANSALNARFVERHLNYKTIVKLFFSLEFANVENVWYYNNFRTGCHVQNMNVNKEAGLISSAV